MTWWWSWILTTVGIVGFILAGRKVWWAWYVNIGCQGLWFAYAIVSGQYGFIVASILYTIVFTRNAVAWTREHHGHELRPVVCRTCGARFRNRWIRFKHELRMSGR